MTEVEYRQEMRKKGGVKMADELLTPEEVKELQDELRVGKFLTAKLTDQCRELEFQLSRAKAERLDRPDRTKIAEQLYSWHCEAQDIPGKPLKEQNAIVRGYWMAKADQILALFPGVKMDRPDREQIRMAIRPWCYEKGGSCSAVKHFLCKTCNSTIDALLALFPVASIKSPETKPDRPALKEALKNFEEKVRSNSNNWETCPSWKVDKARKQILALFPDVDKVVEDVD